MQPSAITSPRPLPRVSHTSTGAAPSRPSLKHRDGWDPGTPARAAHLELAAAFLKPQTAPALGAAPRARTYRGARAARDTMNTASRSADVAGPDSLASLNAASGVASVCTGAVGLATTGMRWKQARDATSALDRARQAQPGTVDLDALKQCSDRRRAAWHEARKPAPGYALHVAGGVTAMAVAGAAGPLTLGAGSAVLAGHQIEKSVRAEQGRRRAVKTRKVVVAQREALRALKQRAPKTASASCDTLHRAAEACATHRIEDLDAVAATHARNRNVAAATATGMGLSTAGLVGIGVTIILGSAFAAGIPLAIAGAACLVLAGAYGWRTMRRNRQARRDAVSRSVALAHHQTSLKLSLDAARIGAEYSEV